MIGLIFGIPIINGNIVNVINPNTNNFLDSVNAIDCRINDCNFTVDTQCQNGACDELPLSPELETILISYNEFLETQTIQAEPITSDDSIIEQVLDELTFYETVQTFSVTRILTDTLTGEISEESVSDIQLISNSFITFENDFADITQSNVSYRLEINSESDITNGRVVLEFLDDGVKFDEQTISLKESPKNGKITKLTKSWSPSTVLGTTENKIHNVEIKILELFFHNEQGKYFLQDETIVHGMKLDKNSNKIIKQDEIGNTIKIYPTDDLLTINSDGSGVAGKGSCYSSTKGNCNRWAYTFSVTAPAPPVGAITVTDSNGVVVASSNSFAGSGSPINHQRDSGTYQTAPHATLLSVQIQRDSIYHVHVGTPNNVDFDIKTPVSQKNYVFGCNSGGCNFP